MGHSSYQVSVCAFNRGKLKVSIFPEGKYDYKLLSDKLVSFSFQTTNGSLLWSHLSWNSDIMVGVEAVGRNKLYPELLWSELQDMDFEWGFYVLVLIFPLVLCKTAHPGGLLQRAFLSCSLWIEGLKGCIKCSWDLESSRKDGPECMLESTRLEGQWVSGALKLKHS